MSTGVLKKFYNSKAWKLFREQIILSRGTKCEDCKQMIPKSREIHIHHVEELTEVNYTDNLISLNPNNVKLLCHSCHNKIHGRWSKGARKKKARGIYIVYGPPMSGKTSYVKEQMERGDIVVDMDRLYESVTLLDRYDKPDNLKYNVLGLRNHLVDNIKTRYGNFNSAWIIGGYASKFDRERLAKDLGAELIYIDTDKEDCLYRLKYCNDYRQEHYQEWEQYIEKWFRKYTK